MLAMSMSEGAIAEWFVADGGQVTEGDPLYSIEAEKSVFEIDAPSSGIVRHIAAVGETLPVGAEVCSITPLGQPA
jgi:pyruvate/2-oxoglutarate dehydrogenase complex dihydrolipoamide acyltransferase (E2) component